MDGNAATGGDGSAQMEDRLAETLRDIGIPPRPLILERIGSEMRAPEADFQKLTHLISGDVGISAGLLKTANSPYFGFRTRARTIAQALVMLGLDVTARAVAGLALRQVFAGMPAMERFWDVSASVARTSGWLVQQLGVKDGVKPDDAYTFGLFRDCGISILMRRFPGYASVLREANEEAELSFTDVEKAHCPTSHALVGSLMAQDWWLPEDTSNAIRCHHDAIALGGGDQVISAASVRLVALSQLAEHIIQRVGGRSKSREWEKLAVICRDRLGLDEPAIAGLAAEAAAVVGDTLQ